MVRLETSNSTNTRHAMQIGARAVIAHARNVSETRYARQASVSSVRRRSNRAAKCAGARADRKNIFSDTELCETLCG